MIDWLTFSAPCAHAVEVCAGRVISMGDDGSLEWHSLKRLGVAGSFDDRIHIVTDRSVGEPLSRIRFDGNPVKWFQGHNLWGTDDLHGLVVATMEALTARPELGLTPTADDRAAWHAGSISLTRVDVTDSYHLPTRADVLAWLRAAEQSAHLAHRGRGQLTKGSTLYFGKHSRRWSLKLYAKGQEIEAAGHGQTAILRLPHALAWADKSLRAEMVIRGQELRRRGLGMVSEWSQFDGVDSAVTAELLRPVLGNLTMTTTNTLPAESLDALTHAQRGFFLAWQAGHDLRAVMSRAAFYRLRAAILSHGIDVAVPQPREVSNVVPMLRVLEAVPAGVPEWAIGTPLYFEPRRVA